MAVSRATLATIIAAVCIFSALLGVSDASMARVTCHCDSGDIRGGVNLNNTSVFYVITH